MSEEHENIDGTWEPYTGFQTVDYTQIKTRFKSDTWRTRYMDLIYRGGSDGEKYTNAELLESVTFFSYIDNNTIITNILTSKDLIQVKREKYDKFGNIYYENIYIKPLVGQFHIHDTYLIGDTEYKIIKVHTMRKKDWLEVLK